MHAPRSLSTFFAVWSLPLAGCAQDDPAPALPAGPALIYEDAYPAQELFDRPLFVAFHDTDPASAYVVTQPGRVFRIARDGTSGERELFLDLREKVILENWEEGLLGFQFDPAYADNGHVWVYWSEPIEARTEPMARGKRKSERQSVISRFTVADGDAVAVDPATELRVLEVFQPFGNHNGGTIVFGPDRMLYIALGDGGAANDPYGNAESLDMLLGKVLRIDVRDATVEQPYQIPADNPFVATDGARGEIWCYGLRNVWRMAFDRVTDELWAGDVGQNRVEEVDVLKKGGFYGWNTFEGDERFELRRNPGPTPDGHIPPVVTYTHQEGLSITGGHVYRGAKIQALVGFYVYGDFMTKRMWACRRGGDGGAAAVVTLANAPFQPASFAEQPDGELLMMVYVDKDKGKVLRLAPAGD
jgi:glucose/arabinose dehydrogenase